LLISQPVRQSLPARERNRRESQFGVQNRANGGGRESRKILARV
jgi:hypothetical protein